MTLTGEQTLAIPRHSAVRFAGRMSGNARAVASGRVMECRGLYLAMEAPAGPIFRSYPAARWLIMARRRRARRDTGWSARRTYEVHYSRGRIGDAPLSPHAGGEQAIAAGVRQAHGVLPAVDADAGRHPRHPRDHHAARRAAVPAVAAGRPAVGREPALRKTTKTTQQHQNKQQQTTKQNQTQELPRARRQNL